MVAIPIPFAQQRTIRQLVAIPNADFDGQVWIVGEVERPQEGPHQHMFGAFVGFLDEDYLPSVCTQRPFAGKVEVNGHERLLALYGAQARTPAALRVTPRNGPGS
jgi:hypothetical protein